MRISACKSNRAKRSTQFKNTTSVGVLSRALLRDTNDLVAIVGVNDLKTTPHNYVSNILGYNLQVELRIRIYALHFSHAN